MGNKKPQAIDWKSRIVGYGKQPADQFLHHPNNPKIHPQNQQDALAGAISEIGFISPVIVNRTTGYLVDGHERVWLAMQTNAEVDYVEVELSVEEEAYALVTLDPIGYLARHDSEMLGTLLQDVHSADEAVMTMISELAEANGALDVLGIDSDATRVNNNFGAVGGELGDWVGFNFGHIMVSLPREIHDRLESYVDAPEHTSRKEAIVNVLLSGLEQCLKSQS